MKVKVKGKLTQLCPTLCDPIDGSPPGSSVPGILQARILEWVAISFSKACLQSKSLESCLTLWDPIDGSPPGSSVPGILQARILEWVAISFSNAWKWQVKVKALSHVRLLATPWTAAYQAPLSMGFSRQEYWSGLPLPSPSYQGIPSNTERKDNLLHLCVQLGMRSCSLDPKMTNVCLKGDL